MDLIETARELQRLQVELRLTVCGDGELRGPLEEAIRAHGLSDCVAGADRTLQQSWPTCEEFSRPVPAAA